MKNKLQPVFVTALAASAVFLAGCATQTVRGGGKAVSVADGLYYSKDAAFVPPQLNTIDNYGAPYAVNATPSGKRVSLLWGLFTYTDY
ncbi:MAG: hypothetical protein LBR12_01360 [Opitutaceae bacterium]|jgi:predicted small secreted protein|nr:hypothetical protein [Opitutaceae bacterium]